MRGDSFFKKAHELRPGDMIVRDQEILVVTHLSRWITDPTIITVQCLRNDGSVLTEVLFWTRRVKFLKKL